MGHYIQKVTSIGYTLQDREVEEDWEVSWKPFVQRRIVLNGTLKIVKNNYEERCKTNNRKLATTLLRHQNIETNYEKRQKGNGQKR